MITTNIGIISHIRSNYVKLFDLYSTEQLNKVPEGFNNNILWNLGHLLVTDEIMFYQAAGRPANLDEQFIARFRRGTRPEGALSEADTEKIKQEMQHALLRVQEDHQQGKFAAYTPMTLSSGIVINNIGDAIAFAGYHHGLHTAAINNLRKFI
ncbi:DinB superfamily protein [Chitinophaga jiangningensis]|uniref:DinB superfamily protein n=1 Tax=Chitinophaga jiangningensis TaxID=1419482 RepID=A0A1M6ZX77_9BACT|nr:DinB family protein [Chitinophaga jiangningensis]SHL35034.1 DinB superfamily protein [Chitinophaga jiangningensis]